MPHVLMCRTPTIVFFQPVLTACHVSFTQEPRRLQRPIRVVYVHVPTFNFHTSQKQCDVQVAWFPWKMAVVVQDVLFCASSAPTYLSLHSVYTEPVLSSPTPIKDVFLWYRCVRPQLLVCEHCAMN